MKQYYSGELQVIIFSKISYIMVNLCMAVGTNYNKIISKKFHVISKLSYRRPSLEGIHFHLMKKILHK